MKLKKKLCLLLAALLALTCAACAKKGTAVPPAGSGTAADSAAASAVPAPTEPAAALIGAKTQQELVEHVAAFFRSGCDAQELLPYYDHDFFLVYYLTDDDMGNFVNSMDAALPIIASMRRGEVLGQERLDLRIGLARQVLRTADGGVDALHHVFQERQRAVFPLDDSLPVPLVHIQRVQVVQLLVGTNGIHIRIDAIARFYLVFCQRQTLPFCQRMHHLCTGIAQILNRERHCALHTIQVIVDA